MKLNIIRKVQIFGLITIISSMSILVYIDQAYGIVVGTSVLNLSDDTFDIKEKIEFQGQVVTSKEIPTDYVINLYYLGDENKILSYSEIFQIRENGAFGGSIQLDETWKSGDYIIEMQIESNTYEHEIKIRRNTAGGTLDKTVYSTPFSYGSPLKQVQNGVEPENVECREGLLLLEKQSTRQPICLSEPTAKILVNRGYASSYPVQ